MTYSFVLRREYVSFTDLHVQVAVAVATNVAATVTLPANALMVGVPAATDGVSTRMLDTKQRAAAWS